MKPAERDRELDALRAELVAEVARRFTLRDAASAHFWRDGEATAIRGCIRGIRALDATRADARRAPPLRTGDTVPLVAWSNTMLVAEVERLRAELAAAQGADLAAKIRALPSWQALPWVNIDSMVGFLGNHPMPPRLAIALRDINQLLFDADSEQRSCPLVGCTVAGKHDHPIDGPYSADPEGR